MLKISELARVDIDTIYPLSQSIETDFDTSYKLVELNDEIVTYLEQGGCLKIRGYPEDKLIVCTDNQTYQIKAGETSNSLLILNNCVIDDTHSLNQSQTNSIKVKSIKQDYYMLSSSKPCWGRIKKLLEPTTYPGSDQCEGNLYSFDDLRSIVQLSDYELKEGLNTLNAVELNGFYRMLDHAYYSQILSHILSFVEENSWPNDQIPLKDTLDILEELFPRSIIDFVFHKITQPTECTDKIGIFALDSYKVCQFFAEDILLNAGKMELDTFERVWKMSVPDGITTNMSYLKGLAIIDEVKLGKSSDLPGLPVKAVIYLPFHSLPENLSERLEIMFGIKMRWTLDEITCYVQEFLPYEQSIPTNCPETQAIEMLLNKYARRIVCPILDPKNLVSKDGGVQCLGKEIYYGPKYPHLYK